MGKKLEQDDVAVDMSVLVLNYHAVCAEEILGPGFQVMRPQSDTMPCGIPLKIVCVELPFVIVDYKGRRHPLDLRTVDLMQVSEEYAKAYEDIPAAPTVTHMITPISLQELLKGMMPPTEEKKS